MSNWSVREDCDDEGDEIPAHRLVLIGSEKYFMPERFAGITHAILLLLDELENIRTRL